MEAKQWYKSKKLWSGVGILFFGITALLTGEKTLDANTIAELVATIFGITQTILAIIEGNPIAFGKYTTGQR